MQKQSTLTLLHPAGDDLQFSASFLGAPTIAVDSANTPVGPSPMDLVLAAVGGCTAMDVISILRKQRQQVTGYEIVVTGERRSDHPKIFTSIDVTHRVRGRSLDRAGVERAVELSDTKYCSVHAMLHDTVRIRSHIELIEDAS